MSEIVIGVIADTHVPDRAKNLHPGVSKVMKSAGVSRIFHAGDLCCQAVIDELAEIAPVTAVQGNRDLLINGNTLPKTLLVDVHGKKIGLMHGFGNMGLYIFEKLHVLFRGYQFSYFHKLATKTFPDADVVIFGHTHRPENVTLGGQLILNPGSASVGAWGFPPSCGILRITPDGSVRAEIMELTGAVMQGRRWVSV